MTGRIDPDYDPTEREVESVARLFALVSQRVGSLHYSNGRNGFQKWILAIVAAVAVIGVAGIVGMYGRLASVETSLMDLKAQVTTLEAILSNRR